MISAILPEQRCAWQPNFLRLQSATISRGIDIDIIHLNGSIEIAPLLGLSDVIVDIVETGATLRENDLEVKQEIFDISARLIANKSAYKFGREAIDDIIAKLSEMTREKEERKMIKILEYCEVERSEIFARTEPCANAEATVRDIIADVRARGDEALLEYGRRFDSPGLDNLTVSAEEIDAALESVEPEFLRILR